MQEGCVKSHGRSRERGGDQVEVSKTGDQRRTEVLERRAVAKPPDQTFLSFGSDH